MQKYFLFGILFIPVILSGQTTTDSIKNKIAVYGGFESNAQWYLNDNKREIIHPENPIRSNNYLFVNANYGKFTAGIQAEGYFSEALLNFNPKYKEANLGTFYLNYKTNKIDITVGHFYEQFGSGLVLRSWEDRSLGINNALRGVRVIFKPIESINLTALYGKHRTGFDVANSDVFGFNSDFDITQMIAVTDYNLTFGLSYVGRYEETNIEEPNFNELTNIFSARFAFSKNAFYLNGEYNFKGKDAIYVPALNNVDNDFVKSGSGALVNFGYTKKGIGIDVSLRRLENMNLLSERVPEVLAPEKTSLFYNDRIMNFTPALTKQHHSNLTNIYVYQAQPQVNIDPNNGVSKSGEIGGQIDFFYEFKKGSTLGGKYGTKMSVNLANWYNLDADYTVFDEFGNYTPNYKTNFFGSGDKYFSDYNVEIFKKFNSKFKGTLEYTNQYYNNRLITGAANILVKTNIVSTEGTYNFGNSKALTIGLEHLWADSDRKNWAAMLIEYTHNSNWSLFISDMYNYGYDKNELNQISHGVDDFKIHFYNLGTAFRNGRTRIALNYGRQRGGLVCAGGVCRFVPPSTGVGLSLSTSF